MYAVQCFYIISGFLIALVWDKKYSTRHNGLFLFYTNRGARIYFLYWALLAISSIVAILAAALSGRWVSYFPLPVPHELELYEIFTNLFIFGSAEAYWLGFDQGLYFTMDYTSSPFPVWRTMMFGPAWTLELELTFYLLAPFLLGLKLRTILALIAASFAARFTWYWMGHNVDPWNYRFFPFEIGFFLLGAVTFRLSKLGFLKPRRAISYAIFVVIAACILRYDLIAPYVNPFVWLFAFAASVPYLFALTGTWKFDGFLADMSYPLYLVHWPVWLFIRDFLPPLSGFPRVLPAVASIVAAAVCVFCIERPIEKWRHRRINSDGQTALLSFAR